MANSSIVDLKDAITELDCPICTETFIPPIYICPAGHSICSGCRSKVQNCPTCRTAYSNGRNYSLENILNAAQRHCKYLDQGCKDILKGGLYNSHIESCAYRDVKCLCCDENGIQYTKFLKHLEAQHRDIREKVTWKPKLNTFIVRYTLSHDQANNSWDVRFHKFKNDVVVFTQSQLVDSILYFAVWKYPHDTVGLTCNMKLSLGHNFLASWKMKVNSFRNTFAETIENGAVAAVPRGSVFSNTEINAANQTYSFVVTYEIEEE